MKENKHPEFMLLLKQFFTEYMSPSSRLSPNTVRSCRHSFRLLFQYVYQVKNKEANEIAFRNLNYETIDGFLKWIESGRGCLASTRNRRLSALTSFANFAQNRNFEAATVFTNAVKRIPVEICGLKARDFLVGKNLYKLTIIGKGDKTCRIVIARPSGIFLKRYLKESGRAGQPDA